MEYFLCFLVFSFALNIKIPYVTHLESQEASKCLRDYLTRDQILDAFIMGERESKSSIIMDIIK